MNIEWWHWSVAGIVLLLAELAIPAFVLVWFGLGGLVVALILWVSPGWDITAQLTIWLLVSVGLVVLWFRWFKPGFHKTRIGLADANVVGEVGLLTVATAPFQKGAVRFQKPLLGADLWPCIADDPIEVGARVKVLSVEGSFLKVGKI